MCQSAKLKAQASWKKISTCDLFSFKVGDFTSKLPKSGSSVSFIFRTLHSTSMCRRWYYIQSYPIFIHLFIWGFTSLSTLYRSYRNQYIQFVRVLYCKTADQRQATTSFPTWGHAEDRTPPSEVGGESVTTLPPWPLYPITNMSNYMTV